MIKGSTLLVLASERENGVVESGKVGASLLVLNRWHTESFFFKFLSIQEGIKTVDVVKIRYTEY